MSKKAKRVDPVRCAIYTRKSTEEGLEQEFNSLDAQRDAAESYIASMRHEGWQLIDRSYDDGGFTGGNMERPALARLVDDIEAGRIDCVVVYKVDRLSRSLLDFARLMGLFDQHGVSFVSVTQQFNTASSMGRLILNVLLSFAQFEREMISERVRDKIAGARRKGKWVGGRPILGYTVEHTKLVVDDAEAERVREIFRLYLELGSLLPLVRELNRRGWKTKSWTTRKGSQLGGRKFKKNSLHALLTNVAYIGQVRHKEKVYPGEHEPIVPTELFAQVQKQLRTNSQDRARGRSNKHGALLSGLLRCKSCDRAMSHSFTCKGARRYRYYVCGTAMQQGWDQCPAPSVPAEEIERFVIEQVEQLTSDPALITEVADQTRHLAEQEREQLTREREGAVERLRGLHEQLLRVTSAAGAEGQLAALAELQAEITTLQRSLQQIDDRLARLGEQPTGASDIAVALRDFSKLRESLTQAELAKVLALIIERVEHDGEEGNVTITLHDIGVDVSPAEVTA